MNVNYLIWCAIICVGIVPVVWYKNLNKKGMELIDAKCGHKTKVKDGVSAFGQTIVTELPINTGGTTLYCHRCLEKMTIRCAWCGRPIFIGDPITLYFPHPKDPKVPEYAVLYDKERNSYVGCLRINCAESGSDRAGFWYPPGEVHRVLTAYEMIVKNVKEGNFDPVVIGDLSKP